MKNRAVLLVNLGSPDAPDTPSLRRYLKQFLMDPYVIQLPLALRALIVYLFVLPLRPKNSALAYRSIWTDKGSPLLALSARLLEELKTQIDIPAALAMRYGSPGIEQTLLSLAKTENTEEVLFVPLYPHYADSTVTTSIEEAKRVITKHGLKMRLLALNPFYSDPGYISSLVAASRRWLSHGFDHLLFSYHGLPESHLLSADPTSAHCLQNPYCCQTPSPAHATCYRHQVFVTTERMAEALGLDESRYSVAFQSRLGRAKWLEPSTEETLVQLAGNGVKKLLVICPAFVTDCLETLEEIEIRGEEVFIAAGGESLTLIPCLNDHPDWITTLAGWIREAGPASSRWAEMSTASLS